MFGLRLVHFNFRVPERYAYLSGSWKLKLAKPKVERTPTVGSISTQRDLYRGDSESFVGYQFTAFLYLAESNTTERKQQKKNSFTKTSYSNLSCLPWPWRDPMSETLTYLVYIIQNLLGSPIFHNTCSSLKNRPHELSQNDSGGVGYFSNERKFTVESSLQRISSKFLLRKRNDSSVILQTWSWRGKPAASARAGLRRANAER